MRRKMEKSPSSSSEIQKNVKRAKFAVYRSHRLKSSLIPWCIALAALTIEIFSFDSHIGRFLLGQCLPSLIVVLFEYILLLYTITVTLWLFYEVFLKSAQGLMHASFGMILPSPSNANSKMCSSFHLLDTSNRTDTSWVQDHHFGTSTEANSSYSRQLYTSPNHSTFSDLQLNVSPGSAADSSLHGIPINIVMPRSSPYNRSIDSIHTREQLDYLLLKEGSYHMDTSATRNSSFGYFNALDIGAPDDRKHYQVSEQIKSSDSKENIVVKMGPGNRVILSPASNDADGQDVMTRLRHTLQHARHSPRKASHNTGTLLFRRESMERRRRSVSSPERHTGAGSIPVNTEIDSKSSCLREIDFIRGEQRLRTWIVNTILEPLDRRIKETNSRLEKEHSSPHLRIGVSSVETLQAALVSRPELLETMLPYIIPFLSVHNNQNYLVGRISELASDRFMMEYVWNGGGKEPVQEKATTSCRVSRRPWGEHLPTDAMLVFSLFSAYMDTQLTSNPLVGTCRLAQPFSALYTLKAPQRPNAVHLAADSFYLHMSTISPPHVDFVFNDADGSPSRRPIPRGTRNLFSAILSFIDHAKANNGGRLDRINIGPTGLNIACILE